MPNNPQGIVWDDEQPQGVVWDDEKPTNTIGQEAKRQGGLLVRALASAAGSVGAIPADAIGKGVNAIAGREVIPNQQRALQQTLSRFGLPEPERGVERFTQGMAETAPAFALPMAPLAQIGGNAVLGATQAQPGQEAQGAAWGAAGGAAVPALGKAMQLAGKGAANVLGTTTGAGSRSVEEAFKNGPGFVENMRGHVEPSAVVDQARQGVQNMRQTMQADYRAKVPQWATNHAMDIAPVDKAYGDLLTSLQHNGQFKIGPAEQRTVQEIGEVLQQFKSDPGNFTVEGFDALKQRLQAIYPDSPAHRQAQRAVSTMANAVKDQIVKDSPVYAEAMKDYWRVSQQLDEIERTLSLGGKATTDTALRKLQSVVRNNVNANFGQRVKLAEQLPTDVLPSIAGQAMNNWTPRGIQALGATGIGGYGLSNPASLAALPAMSPRLVGEAARYSGMAANNPLTQATIEALRKITPSTVRNLKGNPGGNE